MRGFLSRGPLLNVIGGATIVTAVAGGAAYKALGQSRGRLPVPVARNASSDAFLVCVGKDGVLRSAGAGCRPDEQLIKLDRAETKISECEDCDGWGAPPKGSQAGADSGADDRIGQLEQRLDALERSPWFKVVDKTGRVIFEVARDRMTLYSQAGVRVASVDASAEGAVFTARSGDRGRTSSAGVTGERAGLAVSDGGAVRVDAGRQLAGNYAIRIMEPGSAAPIAGMGESRGGGGTLVVADSEGNVRASAVASDGIGAFELSGADGTAIASLRESQSGTGLLSLGKKDGREAVKMDINDGRYGAVLAGPTIGAPLMSGSGLPGSYILGCAGGDSCRPR
jgi:hypothetical protein